MTAATVEDTDLQTCRRCGDQVHTLSSDGQCDGCVEAHQVAWANPPADQVSREHAPKILAACRHDLDGALADCLASLVGRVTGQMSALLSGDLPDEVRTSLQSLLDDANAISHTHYGNAGELAYCIEIGEHPEPPAVGS